MGQLRHRGAVVPPCIVSLPAARTDGLPQASGQIPKYLPVPTSEVQTFKIAVRGNGVFRQENRIGKNPNLIEPLVVSYFVRHSCHRRYKWHVSAVKKRHNLVTIGCKSLCHNASRGFDSPHLQLNHNYIHINNLQYFWVRCNNLHGILCKSIICSKLQGGCFSLCQLFFSIQNAGSYRYLPTYSDISLPEFYKW